MWTGYRRMLEADEIDKFDGYPLFVFIEHCSCTDANEVFSLRFSHRPHEYGKPEWNAENNECLLPLIGGLIDCSNDWCDNADSFELSYRYFIDGSKYIDDMCKLNEFLKRGDVMILSEMEIYN